MVTTTGGTGPPATIVPVKATFGETTLTLFKSVSAASSASPPRITCPVPALAFYPVTGCRGLTGCGSDSGGVSCISPLARFGHQKDCNNEDEVLRSARRRVAVALASAANAAQPLSDTQMDGVTAGAAAIATGQALAIGDSFTFTQTVTSTDAVTRLTLSNGTRTIGSALGKSLSQAAAASALFQAAAATSSQSAATLP